MDYIKIKVDEAKYLEIRDFYDAKEINDPKRPYDLFDIKTINNLIYIILALPCNPLHTPQTVLQISRFI